MYFKKWRDHSIINTVTKSLYSE